MDDSVGRAYFARQLYNLHHMLESEEETGDGEKVDELIIRLNQHDKNHPMMSFYDDNTKDTSGSKRKRRETDVGTDGGAGGVSARDCEELGDHGYDVEPQVFVDDESGYEMESFSYVRQPLPTFAPR